MRLSRKSFEEDFRKPIPEVFLPKISRRQMDAFFRIAKSYWESKGDAVDRAQRRAIQQDVEKCDKLVETCGEQLRNLARAVRGYRQRKWPFASGLSNDVLKEIADWQERLRGVDQEWEPSRRARKRTLSMVTRKNLVLEFTIDLELLLQAEFSQLQEKDRDGLIAGAMAAAGVFTRAEIENAVNRLVERIPIKRKRAREYLKKTYTDPGIERCYPWLPKPRPQPTDSGAPRARKKSKRRRSKRAGTVKQGG